MISCSLGGNGVPNAGETCTVTCNNGYQLTGSGTRNCQNDGSWSGSDAMCSRGEQLLKHIFMHYNYTVRMSLMLFLLVSNLSITD